MKISFVLLTGLLFAGISLGINAPGEAHAACAGKTHVVSAGETLSGIAAGNKTSWQSLASSNHLANPNLIYIGQNICIPNAQAPKAASTPTKTATPAPGDSIDSMINQVFGKYAAQAKRVARCESSMNPRATNRISVGGSHAAGLFQVLYPSTWKTTSQAAKSPYDARANILAAHEIFARDGNSWREWVCKP